MLSLEGRCPEGALVEERRSYDVGLWRGCTKGETEQLIAYHWACEQYIADQLVRAGLVPVLACWECAQRGVAIRNVELYNQNGPLREENRRLQARIAEIERGDGERQHP